MIMGINKDITAEQLQYLFHPSPILDQSSLSYNATDMYCPIITSGADLSQHETGEGEGKERQRIQIERISNT